MTKNSVHRAQITAYSAEGAGIAKIDGMVVFVPHTVCGDLCDIKIVKVLKSHAFGIVQDIVKPSEMRIDSDCAAFPLCGGCDFRHMQYSEELNMKSRRVGDALRRIGGFDVPDPSIVPSPKIEHYRNKAQYPMKSDYSFGMYRRRSHDIISPDLCLLSTERAFALAQAVCLWAKSSGVSIYNEASGKGLLRTVYTREGEDGILLTIVANGDSLPDAESLIEHAKQACPELCGIVLNVNKNRDNRVLGDRVFTLWGKGRLGDSLLGNRFELSPLSFYQVNHQQTEELYRAVASAAQLKPEHEVLELYCGVGTITLFLAPKCARIVGAEIVPQAIEDAAENAKKNGIINAEFICADAGQAAQRMEKQGFSPEVVVVDPPRKAMDEAAREAVLRMSPKRIVYVSCDPASLARDCKHFAQEGYDLTDARAFDMFPRTSHVECVVKLCRMEA